MKLVSTFIALFIFATNLSAQKGGPYKLKASVDFESPRKHQVLDPIGYGQDGIIQFNGKDAESFSLQKFSTELRLMKENKVDIDDRLNKHVHYERLVKFKSKTYLFVREVSKKNNTEGITALEFSPKMMNFVGTGKSLFQSSRKVVVAVHDMAGNLYAPSTHEFFTSHDKTKFMCSYSLVPRQKRDKLNKEEVGIFVFDENLNKLWGGEFEMPYTEAIMDNLGYTLCSDGTVFLLTKVYHSEKRKESEGGKLGYHYEVFHYTSGNSKPKGVEIKLDDYVPQSTYIYEDRNQKIVIAGFYSKSVKTTAIDGAYLLKLDFDEDGISSDIDIRYYEIPHSAIIAYEPKLQKGKNDKPKKSKKSKDEDEEEEPDYAIRNLRVRDIFNTPNGSTKIVSEIYYVESHTYYDGKTTRTVYDTYAEDIYVMNIDSAAELSWVKKIPKSQHAGDAKGAQLSLKSHITGNDLHIFYVDNPKNFKLPETESPARHENRMGGYLMGVAIDAAGDLNKYNLGDITKFETNFYIRYFVDGGNNNLISTERRKKMNMLFSLSIK